ncbi:hypothetical protein UA08_01293 [Talaromyces atroroseus]|uniref:Uncharacterized protein n=1 Tax=Talaromyces atroroseus TaxID=1441469 RepID=A0A1Q5QBL0_TALAT|nr:hypothetical protein UA08_01293 [Talaromyces atroroseus]OKL63300.1 hypothetical protein UA08_01293 [Talaromyces atroroseus]
MALDLDRLQLLQFPLLQQEQHDVPAQPDNSVPRTIASFDSAKEQDVHDGPVEPAVKRTVSNASVSARNESSVKENFATGKDILRRVTLRPSNKSKSSNRQTPSRETPKPTDSTSASDDTTLKERSGNLGAAPDNKEKPVQNAMTPETSVRPAVRPKKARSVSGKIATLARVSWMSSSRSPSPARPGSSSGTARSREHSPTPKSHVSTNGVSSNTESKEDKEPPTDPSEDIDNKKNASSKKYRRPLSTFVTRSKSAEPPPSLRSRKSMDQLAQNDISTPELPPLPKPPALSTIATVEPSRKKDELWTVFRGLEADLHKFQAKSTNLKVTVVRSSLLPFLARYASHPSFNTLRPEDLDRRVNILNKWWTALLTLLNGKHSQPVSGTDRPVFLEAISGIMMRKEWRIPYHPQAFSAHSSNSSLESGSSDFLAESIYHNVRNIFNQNLLSQMSFVVERMSLRHAPASIVVFCGTACAYAFYFCPGVADMLCKYHGMALGYRAGVDGIVICSLSSSNTSIFLVATFYPERQKIRATYLHLAPDTSFGASSVTFDDFIEGPNAAMSTLSLGMANCHRSMAENRLIILLKDFLSEPSPELAQARRIHWNPMVRSYFHRLLCWRLARFNADPTPADSEIYEMLLDKIEQVWAYYLAFNSKAEKENRALLSSEMCSPAPGRRILIIRSDNQHPSPSNLFASFDRLVNPASTFNSGGYQSHVILKLDPNGLPDAQSAPKRRWNLLKSVFGGTANPKPGEVTPPGSVSDENEVNPIDSLMGEQGDIAQSDNHPSTSSQDTGNQTDEEDTNSIDEADHAANQPYNFKFSLENHQWNQALKNRPLTQPSLPKQTFHHVQHQRSVKALTSPATEDEFVNEPRDNTDASTASTTNSYATTKGSGPSVDEIDYFDNGNKLSVRNERLVASKYAGRALAEWAQVVCEFDNFFERRRSEGVPSDELVETPSLSVDNFRK